MVLHNPPKHDPDMPSHEHYATEGHQKFYRPKANYGSATGNSGHQKLHDEEMRKKEAYHKKQRATKEHELPYWEGKDHS